MSAIRSFETMVLVPALEEVCRAPVLLREYRALLVQRRPHPDDGVEMLLAALSDAVARETGPSLVLSHRDRPTETPVGHYVMTVCYDGEFVSPAVIFHMRFNNRFHLFDHRYDAEIEQMPVQSVTKEHIQNHILASFDFYKLHAFAETAFPGYE